MESSIDYEAQAAGNHSSLPRPSLASRRIAVKETAIHANPHSARRPNTGLWATLAILLLAAAFLAYRYHQSGFDLRALLATLAAVRWWWFVAAWLIGLLSYYGRVLRWMVMLRPLAPAARQRDVLSATAIGFSAIYVFGRAGELVRPYLIARSAKVSLPSQFAAWLIERIYDTLIVLALFGYALASAVSTHPSAGPQIKWLLARGGWLIGVTGLLCLAALVILQVYAPRFERRILDGLGFLQHHHQERAAHLVRAAVDGLRATSSLRSVLQILSWSLVEWLIIYACFHATFRAFPETALLGPDDVLAYLGFVAIGSIFQIPGLGGGFQVASILVTTELFHVPLETATSLAFLTWFVSVAGIVPIGILLAVIEGLHWRDLTRIDHEAIE